MITYSILSFDDLISWLLGCSLNRESLLVYCNVLKYCLDAKMSLLTLFATLSAEARMMVLKKYELNRAEFIFKWE